MDEVSSESQQPEKELNGENERPEEFVPCAVSQCGVKVREEEPRLDFASFMERENLLTSLKNQELKEITSQNPLVTNPEPPTSNVVYERTGKPVYGSISTVGYNALRSDFETEFDNQAELLLGGREDPMETLSFPDKQDQYLCDSLQSAIVSMYNHRLIERAWRKRIVRDHALIDSKKLYTVQQRMEIELKNGEFELFPLMWSDGRIVNAAADRGAQVLSASSRDFVIERLATGWLSGANQRAVYRPGLSTALRLAWDADDVHWGPLPAQYEFKTLQKNKYILKKLFTTVLIILKVPFGKRNLLILLKFMRFLNGPELDFIIESILYQISLKQKLNSFLNYRSQGIRFKSGIKIYENLNKKHLKNFNDLLYQNIPLSSEIVGGPRSGRKPSAPLVLHNLPGYNLLDEEEKHLCSTVRLVPEAYHNFKQLLIAECRRHDGLKLAVARQVMKIDVNKTRKMFDLLKAKGHIWPPKSS